MKKHIKHLLLICLSFISFQTIAKTLITNASQVAGTTNLKVDWGETDINLSDPNTSLHKYKIVYQVSGGISQTIDNISSSLRSYTITGLSAGTYTVELIEVIRVIVPSTPFSPPYVDIETGSGAMSVSIFSLNQAPIANCSNRTLAVGNGTSVNLWGYQAGEGSTDPNGDPLTFSLYPEGPYGVGNHQIELTVTDPEGLSSKCYFTLTVVDQTPPVILAKNAVIIMKANGYAELNIEDVDNGSFDNVSWVYKTISKSVFTCDEVGFNSVTLTVKDESGNEVSQNVTVQVLETTEPYIVDKPINLHADARGLAILSKEILDTLVYDNCGLKQVVVSKDTFYLSNPSDFLDIIATDKSGNVSAKKLAVTIKSTYIPSVMGLIVAGDSTMNEPEIKEDSLSAKVSLGDELFAVEKVDFGFESLTEKEDLFTYGPNPLEDRITVKIHRNNLALYTLQVRDRNGNLVQSHPFKTNEISLDLSKSQRGTYFINVMSIYESATKRIELKR